MKNLNLTAVALFTLLAVSACNDGGGGDAPAAAAGPSGTPASTQTATDTTASTNPPNSTAAAPVAQPNPSVTIFNGTLTRDNQLDALRAVLELTFKRPMYFAGGGSAGARYLPYLFDYRTLSLQFPCAFGGYKSWLFNDANQNGRLDLGEAGLVS